MLFYVLSSVSRFAGWVMLCYVLISVSRFAGWVMQFSIGNRGR